MIFSAKKSVMPTVEEALAGHAKAMPVNNRHFVKGIPIAPPFPENMQQACLVLVVFGEMSENFSRFLKCSAQRLAFSGGFFTPNPNYEEVCTGLTGHNEVVLVAYEPTRIFYSQLLCIIFWESHDLT